MRDGTDFVGVMAAYSDLVCVCVVHCAKRHSLHSEPNTPPCTVNHTHAHQVRICRHNTDNVCTDTHCWTRLVILAKNWLWIPDDGSYVNRNMLERSLLYLYRARNKITQLSIPTLAQLQRHRLKFIKNHLKNSYMFRSSTIFRELQYPR